MKPDEFLTVAAATNGGAAERVQRLKMCSDYLQQYVVQLLQSGDHDKRSDETAILIPNEHVLQPESTTEELPTTSSKHEGELQVVSSIEIREYVQDVRYDEIEQLLGEHEPRREQFALCRRLLQYAGVPSTSPFPTTMSQKAKLIQNDDWVKALQPDEWLVEKAATSDAANQLIKQLEDCAVYICAQVKSETSKMAFRRHSQMKRRENCDPNPLGM